MSIQSEITRISGNVADALTAIAAKGVTVPQGANSDDLADLIAAIASDLTTKTITLNGSYSAQDDNADGYSAVTVNVQNGASMTEVANTYGTELVITSAQSAAPSATRHTLYFEYEDTTTETEYAYYDDSFISSAITATTPTTRSSKTVTLAQLDGTTWYSYTPTPTPSIPLNTELIDYSKVTNNMAIYSDGSIQETEWIAVSDYTVIDPTMTFTFKGNCWYYIAFYDSSKTLLDVLYIYDNSTVSGNVGTGTLSPSNIPAGSAWVRISCDNNPDSSELSLIRTA